MTNRSRVVLYTGVTNDLKRRVWEHRHGEVKGFAKRYRVDRLVYFDDFTNIRDAIAWEKQNKGWTRAKKNALVETQNPRWTDLSRTLFDPVRAPLPSSRLRMTTARAASSIASEQTLRPLSTDRSLRSSATGAPPHETSPFSRAPRNSLQGIHRHLARSAHAFFHALSAVDRDGRIRLRAR